MNIINSLLKKGDSLNTIYAMLIIFLSSSVSIVTTIYSTTLFFMSYPASWLVYFLCAQTTALTLTGLALKPALMRDVKLNAQNVTTLFVVLLVGFYFCQKLDGYWLPMIVAIATGTLGSLGLMVSWNLIPLAFHLRKYKDIARYARQMSALGIISSSFIVPLMLAYYSVSSLLVFSIICMLGTNIFIYLITLLQQPSTKKIIATKKSPVQFQLYKQIIIYSLLIVLVQSLIDYLFKLDMAKEFKSSELAAFQGYYIGLSNIAGLVIGMLTTKYLLKRVRLDGLLYITQFLLLIAWLAAFFYPSIWTMSVLASVKIIFIINYASLAIEIILNFFPSIVRIGINFKITNVYKPIFTIIIYFLLLFIATKVNEKEMLIFILVLTIFTFYSIRKIGVGYKAILQQESDFRRFNLIEENFSIQDSKLSDQPADLRSIPFLLSQINDSKNPSVFIKLLAAFPGQESETAILSLVDRSNVWQRTIAAKESRYRACQLRVGTQFRRQATELAVAEAGLINYLDSILAQQSQPFIKAELTSRIQLATERALSWLAVATDPLKVSQIIPALLKPSTTFAYQQAKEKALELLEVYIKDHHLKNQIISIFDPSYAKKVLDSSSTFFHDDWLTRIINLQAAGAAMDSIAKIIDLRQVELFKGLPSEILSAIAEETDEISFRKGEFIFKENDVPDGLYCICSGKVQIVRQNKVLNILEPYRYFGELGLIDDTVRAASAVAETDCTVLFLEKNTFERITDDLPEVLRVVTKVILSYLRKNLAAADFG